MENDSKRFIPIDYLRALAILCVILNHCVESIYSLNYDLVNSYSLYKQIFVFTLFTLGRIGVPIFLFISGYLLLDRDYNTISTFRFWKHNLLGLILTVEIWIFVYNIFNSVYYEVPISLNELVRNLLFLKATNFNHMWYMPTIIGIYLFLPLISNMLKSISLRTLIIPLFIAWIYLFIIPELNLIFKWGGYDSITSQLDLSFSGNVYGIYIILGYLMKKEIVNRLKSKFIVLVGILSFLFTVFVQVFSYRNGVAYNVWYNNGTLFLTGISIFLIGVRFSEHWLGWLKKIVMLLSKLSFGLYLIHNPVLMIVRSHVEVPFNSIRFLFIFVLTIIISTLLVWVLCRDKTIARVLFHVRI